MGRYKWKEYDKEPREQDSNKIRATINRRGTIYLNERAIKAMGEPEVVVLMYDSYHQTIGVKASTIDKRNAFRPKKKDDRVGGKILYAANFCREFSIKPRGTLAFVRAEVDNEGVLILGMRDTMPAGKK
jgi:hypothetical protein